MASPPRLEGKVVVVTGASAGVGRATARAFAEKGADVALIARGRDGLEGARREVEAFGRRALMFPFDITDAAQVERAANEIEERLGPIAVWVNDAMVSVFAPFLDTAPEEFRRVTEVTYLGCVYGTRAALSVMRPRGDGKIIQIGSALAYRSIPLQSAYCGAKAAIRAFTDALRCELAHDRVDVDVTMVQLPAVNTPQFDWVRSRLPRRPRPLGPVFQPEVAARAIVWAATHRCRELRVGGPALSAMILAAKVFPSFGDAYLARHGYASQQTDERRDPRAPDNLFVPVPGDHGAHGRFDAHARSRSWELWASLRGKGVGLTLGTVLGAGILAVLLYVMRW
jgi:NAD(P)-dependent dehydrogenase (short-subunit alcohol dehydrogenase family)